MKVYVNDPKQPAQACIIWLHGLGANAEDMAGLSAQLTLDVPVRNVFADAPVRPVTINRQMPMQAWYDIMSLSPGGAEDQAGILQSVSWVDDLIHQQASEGFDSTTIYLAGFSQGGVIALYAGLQCANPLGGIVSLSAYLPLACKIVFRQDKQIPIFMARGTYDPIVNPAWTEKTLAWIQSQGYQNVAAHQYPMEHSVCAEEIRDLSNWLASEMGTTKLTKGENA